ncbi:phosphate propanoyltransferase [Desulfosporosinus fructosivorans]|uniref:Phosphate propanoyltransferase n=1 Tax=Desulfosporosinus fructosivorans TaxID=2018669 RepID=A0A4Z0R0B4_9FIRM|nr:phosphate propanoyltransferase [Desulfosporosinus fructosivorans]TGE35417.1 phosphate propanoyltransferase [Desulfosporosinus fructosivorans]
MIVTEYELRANWHKTKEKVIVLPPGSVITPSARDFIRSKGIDVQIEGNGILDINKTTFSNAQQTVTRHKPFEEKLNPARGSQTPSGVKPEHMTHLHQGALVTKTHPVIAYRGQLDLFQCELVEAQVSFAQAGEEGLILNLEEIAAFARALMVNEVKETPFHWKTLIGLSPEELRERSHHPQKYFGVDHTPLSYTHGLVVAKLQHLRAKSREVELYANRAFTNESGECLRTDLIQALNRLSSAFYILACEVRGRKLEEKTEKAEKHEQPEKRIPIGVSNRHIHLSKDDLEALFGENYGLNLQKELSQPGQFAAKETVTLVGPKGRIEKVRILGPVRKNTQAEISATDCYKLGIKPVIRDSGQHEGTPGLQLVGPQGQVELESGVMVASRHIHLNLEQAAEWSLNDGDRVRVQIQSKRPMIFEDVLIRVNEDYQKEMHLDLDEANAALIDGQTQGVLMEV